MWQAVEALALAEFVRRSVWAYPALEVVHLGGLAALVGALLVLELRVFGLQPALPLLPLGRLAVRVAMVGFAVAAGSGSLLFAARATELAVHPAFQLKLAGIGLALANAAVFHLRGSLLRHDGVARLQAALSLGLWFGVIAAGRLIGYL